MKKFLLGVAVALTLTFSCGIANAHTALISANPGAGVTLKKLPSRITLKFADPLFVLGKSLINRVSVVDPKGVLITTAKNQTHGAILTNTLNLRWKRGGVYRVSYRVSAEDGHVVTGHYTFTIKN